MPRPRALVVMCSLTACAPDAVLTSNYKADSGVWDTADPTEDDVIEQEPDYGDDTADDRPDTDPPDDTLDLSEFTGSRRYAVDKDRGTDCAGDTVPETGTRLSDGEAAAWEEHCPICSAFYTIDYAAASACSGDVDLSVPEVRGLQLRGDRIEIWRIRDAGYIEVDVEVTGIELEDGVGTYTFEEDWRGGSGTVTVEGTLTFEPLL